MLLMFCNIETPTFSQIGIKSVLCDQKHQSVLTKRFLVAILIICYFITCAQSTSCDERRQIRFENVTAYTFTLTWQLKDTCKTERTRSLESVEVTATLKKFCACKSCELPRHSSDSTISIDEPPEPPIYKTVDTKTHVTFGNNVRLHPYAEYKVHVRSLKTSFKKTLTIRTKYGNPGTVPLIDKTQNSIADVHSIQFYWTPSNDVDCKQQNGIPEGFRVELWGEDPWVKSKKTMTTNGNHYIETKNTPVGYYFAQNLKPYTKYLLKVFNTNIKEDDSSSFEGPELYNHKEYLRIPIQTLPTQPNPPTELEAVALSNRSVHLRWVPNHPPTGRISKYILKRGEVNEQGLHSWKTFIEFDPATEPSLCASAFNDMNNSFYDPYCCVISDLLPETTYFFSVQVFNVNVSKSSAFSNIFNVTTEPASYNLPTSPTVDPILNSTLKSTDTLVTPTTNFSAQKPEGAESSGTVMIVVLSVGVLILLIVCFVLRRKIRQATEKIILRSGGVSHTQQGTLSCFGAEDSLSGPFDNTTPNIESGNEITRNTSCASSYSGGPSSPSFESHVIRSVVNQIEEIQSRKLPDAPTLSLSGNPAINNQSSKGEVLWGLELQKMEEQNSAKTRQLPLPPVRRTEYCDPSDNVRLDRVSPNDFNSTYRPEPPDIIQQHKQIPILQNHQENISSAIINANIHLTTLKREEEDEDCTDTYGYLKPTFLRPNSIQGPPDSPNVEKPPIPKESYTQVTAASSEYEGQSDSCDIMAVNSNQAMNTIRPNSNESELSFSNLRTYDKSQKNSGTNIEFEEHPLISQMPLNV